MSGKIRGLVVFFSGMVFSAKSGLANGANLLVNPDFEKTIQEKSALMPEAFSFGKYSGGEGSVAIDEKIVHSGKYSLRMDKSNSEGWISINQRKTLPVLAEATEFSVSAWIFTEGVKKGSIVVWGDDGKNHQVKWTSVAAFEGSFDWKKFSGSVVLPVGVKSIMFSVRLSGKGIAWIDDCKVNTVTEDAKTVNAENFISNPGMSGSIDKNTGLPANWQKKMVNGLETVCDFKVSQGGGKPAIALEWKHGGPRFGIEPELKDFSSIGNGLEFSAFSKTSGESSAVLIAEALDKDGKIISEYKSEPIKSADWKKATLFFSPPVGMAKVKVYCFNEGQGTVSFSGAELKNAKTKIEEAFPFQAICMPVEMMKDLNGGKGEFNTFSDRPVPLAFEFKGNTKKNKINSLVVEIPKEIKLAECFNSHEGLGLKEEKPEIEKVSRDGKDYLRYTFRNPKVFGIVQPSWAWERKLVMAMLPEDKASIGNKGNIYWYLKADERKSEENFFALNILPPMPGTAKPKNFPLVFYGTYDVNFNNPDLMAKVAGIYEEAGDVVRGRGSAERDLFLEKRGWKMWVKLPDYMHGKFIVNGEGWEKVKDKIEACVRENGKTDKDRICPQYFLSDPDFRIYIKKFLLSKLQRKGLKNGEPVSFDIEPWEPMEWCFCERCRKDFAAYCKLGKTAEISEIKSKYQKEWRDFRCLNTSEVLKMHCDVVRENYPASKIIDYDYVVNFNCPDFRDAYYRVAKDPQLNEKYFDAHLSSYYHYTDKNAFDMIDINARNLKKDYWVLGAIDRSGTYLSGKEVISPAQARMLILASAASGAKGAGFYPGLHIDGKFFVAIDKAMSEIAVLEKFFMEGKRIDSELKVQPLPYFSKKVQVGDREIEIVRPNWKDRFGYRVHSLDGKKLLSIFNYSPDKKAFVKVSAEMPAGKYTVMDPVANKRIIQETGKEFWDASGISGGFIFGTPAHDVRFLMIQPFNEKDTLIPVSENPADIKKEFDKIRKDFSKSVNLMESVKSDKLSIGYGDIRKDGRLQIMFSSPSQKLWVDPECGGILSEWNADGKSICKSGLDIQNNLKSMCWDFFWQPRNLKDSISSLPVVVEKSEIKNGVASVRLKNELKSASIEIFKTYEINATENGFTLKYNIKNKGDKNFSFSFWSHNFPKLASEKLNENMAVLLPLRDGIREITKNSGSFVFAQNENDHPGFSDKSINGLLAGNRIGVWSATEKYGIIAEVDKSQLMTAYLWWDTQPAVEWMYKEVSLSPGAEWKTEIKYSFFDKTDIDSFRKKIERL